MFGRKVAAATLGLLLVGGFVASTNAATFMVESKFAIGGYEDISGMYVGLYGGQEHSRSETGLFGIMAENHASLTSDGDYTSTAYTSLYRTWWSPEYNPVEVADSFTFDYEVTLRSDHNVVARHTFEWTVELSPGPTASDHSNVSVTLGDSSFDFSYLDEDYTYSFWGLNDNANPNYGDLNPANRVDSFDYDDVYDNGAYWNKVNGSDTCLLAGVSSRGGGNTDPVPEPASLILLGSGFAALVARRRRS